MSTLDTVNTTRPTSSEPPTDSRVHPVLERNQAFAVAGGHEGAVVLPNLGLFVITCLDPRTDPAHFLGLRLSDAMVIRNVGGRVTSAVINDIAFIRQVGEMFQLEGDTPLFEVTVIHHTECGSGLLANDEFRSRYAEQIGADQQALIDQAVLDPAATVTVDVEHLRSAFPTDSGVVVSGYVYDVATGLVRTVIP